MTHLDEMIQALKLEVTAIQRKGRAARVDVRDGKRVRQDGGMWLYRFIVADTVNLRDDTPIRIEVDGQEVQGSVVSLRDGVLVVALEEDRGPTIARARLTVDDSFLVERVKERLEEVRDGATYFNDDAAKRTLGLGRPRVADADPDPSVLAGGDDLNEEQIGAVRRALGSDTTFVWGPPGTGKTKTLARIVEAHYRKDRSVLLVSNTNIAVDTALEQVAERLSNEPHFDEGLVLRQGTVVKEELRERFGAQVILDEIAERLGAALQTEREHLLAAVEPLKSEEQEHQTMLDTLDLQSQAQQRLRRHNESLRDARGKATTQEAEAKWRRRKASMAHQDARRAESMGTMRRLLTRVDPERLAREAAIAEGDARGAAVIAAAARERAEEINAETPALRAEAARLSDIVAGYPSRGDIEKKLVTLRAEITHINQRIAEIERELSELEKRILENCRILATTVYQTYLGAGDPRRFDVVVVDEASMLMPPLVYYAAGLATASVTVAGDFRQLAPIVMSNNDLAEQWLKRDVFRIAGIPERVRLGNPPPQLVSLREQYRMRAPICAVVSDLFYDGLLVTARPEYAGELPFPGGSSSLLYIDTADSNPGASFRAGSRSRYNLLHAQLVRSLVTHLAAEGYLPPDGINESVGVVSPYRAQAELIQGLLDERLGQQRARGIAATVHRFQGNEKRTMIIDLTDSTGVPVGWFLRARRLEEDGARLLNVALSRARDHVVLLGNFEYLRNGLRSDALLRKVIEHFTQHGRSIDTQTLP